jgi:hypothetical protein
LPAPKQQPQQSYFEPVAQEPQYYDYEQEVQQPVRPTPAPARPKYTEVKAAPQPPQFNSIDIVYSQTPRPQAQIPARQSFFDDRQPQTFPSLESQTPTPQRFAQQPQQQYFAPAPPSRPSAPKVSISRQPKSILELEKEAEDKIQLHMHLNETDSGFVPIFEPTVSDKWTNEIPTTEKILLIPVTARLTAFNSKETKNINDENRRRTILTEDDKDIVSRSVTLPNLCSINRRDFKIVKARKFRKRKKNYTILIIRRTRRFNDAF